jgi:hypothetical protein
VKRSSTIAWVSEASCRDNRVVAARCERGVASTRMAPSDDRGARRWVERGFQAAYLNRGLKHNQLVAEVWRRKLPLQFWEILSKFRAEDLCLLRIGLRKNPASDGFRLRLTEMEAQAGLGVSLNPTENIPSVASLHFQHGLRASELLLSFDWKKGGLFCGY